MEKKYFFFLLVRKKQKKGSDYLYLAFLETSLELLCDGKMLGLGIW